MSGWESEDTLSDGGDFHEDDRDSIGDFPVVNRQDSIPIVAVAKVIHCTVLPAYIVPFYLVSRLSCHFDLGPSTDKISW